MRLLPFALLFLLTGCDPAAPHARGQLRGEAGMDMYAYRFAIVEISPVEPEGDGQRCRACRVAVPLGVDAGFPIPYDAGGGIGVSGRRQWQARAWLASSAEESASADAPQGVTPFELHSCMLFIGSYCGLVSDVEVTLRRP